MKLNTTSRTAAAALAALMLTGAALPAASAARPQWNGNGWHTIVTCPDQSAPDTTPDTTPDTDYTPDTDTTPDTDATPDNGTVSSLERQVAELVNQERAAYGLAPLTLAADLSDGARLKSQDMRDNGYFDHNSSTYGTPFEMMRTLGIDYRAAAENIAMGYRTAEAVVEGWMNSAGHRANILSDKYTEIGIGHVDGYWTQWFVTR